MTPVRRALLYSVASQYSLLVIQFGEVMLIARLLTPAEIGVFSVAFAGLMIATELRSFGITPYIVREANLDNEKLKCANTVTTTISWTLALTIVLGAPAAASFYKEPGLEPVFVLIGASFLFVPLTAVPFAMLVRKMDFKTTFRINVSVTVTRVVTTLALVLSGFSYLSMAWGLLVSSVIEALVMTHYRPQGLPYSLGVKHLRELLAFGLYACSSSLMRRANEVMPDLMLGRLSSMTSVAILSRGLGLARIFNWAVTQAVRPVVLPLLSSERRADIDTRHTYLKVVTMTTGLGWPFFCFLAFMAYPVMRLLYGAQWDAAVPIAQTFCIWGAIQVLYSFGNEALVAAGLMRLVTIKETLLFCTRFAVLLLSIPHGLDAVAMSLVAVAGLELVVVCTLLSRHLGIGWSDVARATRASAGVALCSSLPPALVGYVLPADPNNLLAPLALAVPLTAVGWLVGVRAFRHPLDQEMKRHIPWLRR